MKIKNAEFVGLVDGVFSRVRVVLEIDGRELSGDILFENDGRDIEVEGDELEAHIAESPDFWEDFWASDSDGLIEAANQKGYDIYLAT